ncbi:phosphotransferase enzyme family protein [Pseudooceanicola nanhaiensis]|uniref:phosphotransferase enzyme family protein n=1 Tax=Pseudooceanicola nanhaiensis TaxID=375761 RepID=UPI001CD7ED7C|nr:phosphotransferase [Pseudooceanicola nanhaiensis]MCA0919988.1 phosphotransferase [Pseudooceanicola nanhaiensis]
MTGLYDDDHVAALAAGLPALLPAWGLAEESEVSLLSLSENATFLARPPGGTAPVVLRVHRPDYHRREEIAAELAWIEALRTAEILVTPAPLPLRDGGHIAELALPGETRQVVGFRFLSGREPDPDAALVPGFEKLGALSARLHRHVRGWTLPAGLTRKTWDFEAAFGPRPLWGDWRAAPGLTAEGRAVLEDLCTTLRERLAAYGTTPDRFGLIHADLRLANLLVEGDRIGVIDFDDCGFSWFLYDFAAAISFHETHPLVPALQAAWLRGYESIAPLPPEAAEMLPVLVLYRRLLLTAWIASHGETETAQATGLSAYTEGTLQLARAFLARG